MLTDTIYGLVGKALDKKAVERIYKVKGRNEKKPFIILISKVSDLEKFGISKQTLLSQKVFTLLKKVWPGPVSIILPCTSTWIQKMQYLHRGTGSLAFRYPAKKSLIEILKKTGPLVAPSANPEGLLPAQNIKEAKKYFNSSVDFYLAGGTLKSEPSTLLKIDKNVKMEILRQGAVKVI